MARPTNPIDPTQGEQSLTVQSRQGQVNSELRAHPELRITTQIFIDNQRYGVDSPSMTGKGLRQIPNPPIGSDRLLWVEAPGVEDDEVADDQVVPLKQGQRFFSSPANRGRAPA